MSDDSAHGIPRLEWPLMENNISREDLDAVIELLRADDPVLTQSSNVAAFEREWSEWLGVRYSVFVNSGSSANLLTMAALRERVGPGQIVLPTLTWVSDITAAIHCGFDPVFVDVNPRTLGMDNREVIHKLCPDTRAVFITHVLGFNALDHELIDELDARQIPLIEDACESYGATFQNRNIGTFGLMSNFSFYYGHHLTTIEGGMISTDDPDLYQVLRMLRSHGLVRESTSSTVKVRYTGQFPDLNPEFIFAYAGYNVRSNEISAIIGRSQLKRLDANNSTRNRNFRLFHQNLDPDKYRTDFAVEGCCNYALVLILKHSDPVLRDNVVRTFRENGVEFRRGASGGGNQLRQPYLQHLSHTYDLTNYPNVDHIHFFGFYIGNYPDLNPDKIRRICSLLNDLPVGRDVR